MVCALVCSTHVQTSTRFWRCSPPKELVAENDPIAYYRQHGRPVAEGIPISNVNQVVHNTKHKTRERFQIWDAGAESASLRRKDYNVTSTTATTTPRPARTLPPTPPPGAFPNPYMSPWFPPIYPGFQSPYGYPPPFNPYGGGYPPRQPNYGPRRRRPKPKKMEDVEEGAEDDGSEGTRKETKEGDDDNEGTKKNASNTSSGKTEEVKITKEITTLKTGKREKGLSRWIKAVDRDVRFRKDEVVGDTKDKGLADTLKGISGDSNGEGTRADSESTDENSGEGTRGDHDPKKLVKFSGSGSNSAKIPARHNKLKKTKVGKKGKKGKDEEAEEDENGPLETVDGEVKVANLVDGDTGADDDDDDEKGKDDEEEEDDDEKGKSKKKEKNTKTKNEGKEEKKGKKKEKKRKGDEEEEMEEEEGEEEEGKEDEEDDDNKDDEKADKKKKKKGEKSKSKKERKEEEDEEGEQEEEEEEEKDEDDDEGGENEDNEYGGTEESDDADDEETEKSKKPKDKKKTKKGKSSRCPPNGHPPNNHSPRGNYPAQGGQPSQGNYPYQGNSPVPASYPPGSNSYLSGVSTTTWWPTTTRWDSHKDDYFDFDMKKCGNNEEDFDDNEEDDEDEEDDDKKKKKGKTGKKGKKGNKDKDKKKKGKGEKGKKGGKKKKGKKSKNKFRSLDYLTSKEKIDNAKRERGQILDELHASDDLKQIRSKASIATLKTICSSEKDEYATRCAAWKDAGYCETNQATRFLWCRKTCSCSSLTLSDRSSRTKRGTSKLAQLPRWSSGSLLRSLLT
ncbi:hypothetical protein Aduo_004474 [Ancylostoma duodenale]